MDEGGVSVSDGGIVNAATFTAGPAAAEAIYSLFGAELAATSEVATSTPLPTTLAGTTVEVTDASGTVRTAPLFFVGSSQINFLVPSGTGPRDDHGSPRRRQLFQRAVDAGVGSRRRTGDPWPLPVTAGRSLKLGSLGECLRIEREPWRGRKLLQTSIERSLDGHAESVRRVGDGSLLGANAVVLAAASEHKRPPYINKSYARVLQLKNRNPRI